jgi:hypothetical protein
MPCPFICRLNEVIWRLSCRDELGRSSRFVTPWCYSRQLKHFCRANNCFFRGEGKTLAVHRDIMVIDKNFNHDERETVHEKEK